MLKSIFNTSRNSKDPQGGRGPTVEDPGFKAFGLGYVLLSLFRGKAQSKSVTPTVMLCLSALT